MEERNVIPFYSGLSATIKSVKEIQGLYNPMIAFDFNSLNFIRPGENKYSEILAFFLDPNQPHGQGNKFLEIFLTHVGLDEHNLLEKHVIVKCECEHVIPHQRRIDILITFGNNEYAIAIENKIWAKDQLNQLHDYSSYLYNKFGNNHCLLYLTPYRNDPSQNSIDQDTLEKLTDDKFLKIIGYTDHIIDCVHDWALNCRAEKVRIFLLDFEQYLKKQFLNENFMGENQIVANYASKNIENLEIAFATFFAIDQIKLNLFKLLENQIYEIAKELHINVNCNLGLDDRYYGFYFTKKSWKYINVSFQFHGKNANELCYGINHKGSEKPIEIPQAFMDNLLNNLTLPKKRDGWWIYYSYFNNSYFNWSNSAQPWVDIMNGKMKETIKKIVLDELAKIGDLDI